MSVLRRAATRFPQQASQIKVLGKIVAYYAGRISRRRADTWADYEPEKLRPVSPINDVPTSFAARVILEHGYQTLIEIGTHTGHRAIKLKRLFPALDAYGLDIQKQFETPRQFEGVTFRLFDLDFIRQARPRSAIFSVWTLGCMSPDQFHEFLDAAAVAGHDVVFREITPAFAHQGSRPRTARTWYHDYDTMFAQHGYRLMGPRDVGQLGQFDFDSFDLGYFNVATPKAR